MASDAPYGSPTWASVMTTRQRAAGRARSPSRLAASPGGQALRIVNGDEPLDLGPPPGGDGLSHDPLLDRVYSFLLSAIGQAFNGVEPAETLALVRLACDVGDDAPQAARLPLGPRAARPARELLAGGRRAAHPVRPRASLLRRRRSASYERPTCPCQSFAASRPGRPIERAIRSPAPDLWGRPRETDGSFFYATSRSASSSRRIASRFSARDSIWRTRSADRPEPPAGLAQRLRIVARRARTAA